MKMTLSTRLQACCNFIHTGDRVADIGCDHGYLGIHLLQAGIARFVIAADINEGPLQSAVKNAHKYGVEENIRFYLSDGCRNIPQEFDTLICAGMGGDTMVGILSAAQWLKKESYRLILQCQSKTPMLRQYLSDEGYSIRRETVLRDGRFLYTVMEIIYDSSAPRLTAGGCWFPPAVEPTPEAEEYLARQIFSLERVCKYHPEPVLTAALTELKEVTL